MIINIVSMLRDTMQAMVEKQGLLTIFLLERANNFYPLIAEFWDLLSLVAMNMIIIAR